MESGDPLSALMSAASAGLSLASVMQACFAEEARVKTKRGRLPIMEVVAGDYVWAKPDNDPNAPGEWKRVLAAFVRVAPVVRWRVEGQVLRVTPQHETWASCRGGWTSVGSLQAGDLLQGSDGQLPRVEVVADSREVTTVYNLHVEGYNTYFVSADGGDFDIWVHNTEPYGGGADDFDFRDQHPGNWNDVQRLVNDTPENWNAAEAAASRDIQQESWSTFDPEMDSGEAHSRSSEYPHSVNDSVWAQVIAANTNAAGEIIDPETGEVIPPDQVTMEHILAVAEHWNMAGYNQTYLFSAPPVARAL